MDARPTVRTLFYITVVAGTMSPTRKRISAARGHTQDFGVGKWLNAADPYLISGISIPNHGGWRQMNA